MLTKATPGSIFYGDELIKRFLDLCGKDLYALLINDYDNPITAATPFSEIAQMEIHEGYGYERRGPIVLPEPFKTAKGWATVAPKPSWQARGGPISAFTKIVYACHAEPECGSGKGILVSSSIIWDPPVRQMLNEGDYYEHQLTIGVPEPKEYWTEEG